MSAAALRRTQRWFWALTTMAVCASGALYEGLRASPGPGTALSVLVSGLVLAVSAVQAARILTVLADRPRRPRRLRPRAATGEAAEGPPH
ncbi:hypothetical protein ACWDG1_44335 [Streptomyces sp. NPDC001177]